MSAPCGVAGRREVGTIRMFNADKGGLLRPQRAFGRPKACMGPFNLEQWSPMTHGNRLTLT